MSLEQTKQLDSLFNTCLQRSFPNQDVAQVRRSCSRLANLCSYSGTSFVASKHWLSEFKDRQKALSREADAEKKAKKEKKAEKKQAKKEAKKQKKQAKKDKKGKKGKKGKKDKKSKKEKKAEKKQAKEAKKAEKKQKKEAKKQAKQAEKEAQKNLSPEQKKAQKEAKKAAKKDKKKAKAQKKKEAKKEKKAKKFQKKAGKVGKKLISEEDKLEKKQRKISKKLAALLEKSPDHEASNKAADVEKRLAVIRENFNNRDRSISRYATCLAFVNEKPKDAVDAQCVALKKAAEFAFKAEQCWARYLDVMTQCKAQNKKKQCYKSLGGLDAICAKLEESAKSNAESIFGGKESAETK
eukprot:TRINITY_DN175_c0_g1_i1.p1 TRINITY_DN175_c0_g1~~TRINITY_DN175_c0_g1_i1.p1  ORF type:complete len:353 (-),score=147.42 TRINITY_DN175_c0_g1_i1:99-1157(-)